MTEESTRRQNNTSREALSFQLLKKQLMAASVNFLMISEEIRYFRNQVYILRMLKLSGRDDEAMREIEED